MPLLLDIGVALYHSAIRAAVPFSPKARAWVEGRRGLWQRMEAKGAALQGCVWMHCASVGEFEQGRPVLEAIVRAKPGIPVLITFFSPSGYEARKDFPLATHVEYLPADGPANAQRFLDLARPRVVLWVKYEFWPQWLLTIKARGIPAFLISGIFRPEQAFFKWYGAAHRGMLRCFAHLFVQDERSIALLDAIGMRNVAVSGDTRFDRVEEIARANERMPIGLAFHRALDAPVLIAGSTWAADEELLRETFKGLPSPPRLMAVPHEPSDVAVDRALSRMPMPAIRWSELERLIASSPDPSRMDAPEQDPFFARTLVVDRLGLLARLYQYADLAYVGGGFGDGIHSILEAAAWGKPVIFGPNHRKFAEAQGLIEAGGGFEVRDAAQFRAVLNRLLGDRTALEAASAAALGYVRERVGATERIVERISAAIG